MDEQTAKTLRGSNNRKESMAVFKAAGFKSRYFYINRKLVVSY